MASIGQAARRQIARPTKIAIGGVNSMNWSKTSLAR
jgi:hypothetical protein